MKILIFNQPFGNRGDEAAHKAMMRAFLQRIPDASFVVLSLHMAKSLYESSMVHNERIQYVFLPSARGYVATYKFMMRHHLPIWMNIHPLKRKICQYIKSSDLVVSAPGGICMGGFMNWHHVYLMQLVKYYKKPLAYYGRSFGPFKEETKEDRLFKEYSLDIIRYFLYLGIRDAKTEQIADELGIRYTSSIDTVFVETPNADAPKIEALKHRYMVFVPNKLTWHYKYTNRVSKETIDAFYKSIVQMIWKNNPDMHIVMLPQLFGIPGWGDYEYMKELEQTVGDKRLIALPDTYDSDQQQAIIRGAEYVIGARYHSVVFAINQERPFIALSYEFKIAGLLAKLGMENRMVDIENIWTSEETIENAEKRIDDMIRNINGLGNVSRKQANAIANQALDEFVERMA
ncbi:MAG: polysaccharide pyruvyl transferase family protein [Paludibacteraceae bacterium]|nr:polysaccharide pyruvyl transferase family protein [Paludibacteraceae bacterium]